MITKNGALKIARLGGVDVYVHWTWALLLAWYVQMFSVGFDNKWWVAGVVACFALMTFVHEGVEITCGKLVGGSVSEATLSFLGRGSNLIPPQRPWPIILTYMAGILGYAAFLGITIPLWIMGTVRFTWTRDVAQFSFMILVFNVILLIWTAAPVYPLSGGRVLRALLWLLIGREGSLRVACVLGLLSTIGIVALALYLQSWWVGLMALLIAVQCVQGFKEAKMLGAIAQLPRRKDVCCPRCQQHPIAAFHVRCDCGAAVDPFATRGLCVRCGSVAALHRCALCLQRSPIADWYGPTGLFEVQATSSAAATPPLPPDDSTASKPD